MTERERATGAQMVIAIFPSLEGESLEDFSIRLAERWRVGDKKLDNGVIFLVFVQERRIRLEVGYGLEPVLPDAVASQIIREQIGPRFREGRWADGLMAAVDAVFARIDTRGATPPPPRAPRLRSVPDDARLARGLRPRGPDARPRGGAGWRSAQRLLGRRPPRLGVAAGLPSANGRRRLGRWWRQLGRRGWILRRRRQLRRRRRERRLVRREC